MAFLSTSPRSWGGRATPSVASPRGARFGPKETAAFPTSPLLVRVASALGLAVARSPANEHPAKPVFNPRNSSTSSATCTLPGPCPSGATFVEESVAAFDESSEPLELGRGAADHIDDTHDDFDVSGAVPSGADVPAHPDDTPRILRAASFIARARSFSRSRARSASSASSSLSPKQTRIPNPASTWSPRDAEARSLRSPSLEGASSPRSADSPTSSAPATPQRAPNARLLSLQTDERATVVNGIFADADWVLRLRQHLALTMEEEMAMFLAAVRDLRSTAAGWGAVAQDERVQELVRRLLYQYVLPGASHEICLSCATRRDVCALFEAGCWAELLAALARCEAEVMLDLRFSAGFQSFLSRNMSDLIGDFLE